MGARDKKLENRYRFRTFAEQIAEISADIAHQVSLSRSSVPEDSETFFHGELLKWSELNLTQHYSDFQRELGGDVHSFAQLLYRKDEIVGLLIKHLSVPDTMALEPLLALLVAVARDLRDDFHVFFTSSVMPLLCRLLDSRLPERLQCVYACLAHLYKLQWRRLLTDLDATYTMYCQLQAGRRPAHVARFAAESFAYVCRKVKDKQRFFRLIYTKLADDPQQCGSVGRLLFECLRGVRGRLHLDAGVVISAQMSLLSDPQMPAQLIQRCLAAALTAAAHHISSCQNAQQLWDSLWDTVLSPSVDSSSAAVTAALQLLEQLVRHRAGLLVPADSCLSRCTQLLGCGTAAQEALQLVAALLCANGCKLSADQCLRLVTQVLRGGFHAEAVLRFCGQLFDHTSFDSRLLPELLHYVHQLQDRRQLSSTFLARLLLHKRPLQLLPSVGQHDTDLYPLDFNFAIHSRSHPARARSTRQQGSAVNSFCDHVVSLVHQLSDDPADDVEQLGQACLLLPHLRPLDTAAVGQQLLQAWTNTLEQLELSIEPDSVWRDMHVMSRVSLLPPDVGASEQLLTRLCLLTDCLLRVDPTTGGCSWRRLLQVVSGSRQLCQSPLLLRCLGQLLGVEAARSRLDAELQQLVYGILAQNLASPYHKIRLLTLQILVLWEEPGPSDAANLDAEEDEDVDSVGDKADVCEDSGRPAAVGLFSACLAAELQPVSVIAYKQRLLHLQKLDAEYLQLPEYLSLAPVLYLLGSLHVPFRLLWKPCSDQLLAHCRRLETAELVDVWSLVLTAAADAVQHTQPAPQSTAVVATEDESEGGVAVPFVREHLIRLEDRVDLSNYRLLLWKLTAELADDLQPNGVDTLASLFLQFLKLEFYATDLSFAQYQDLSAHSCDEQLSSAADEATWASAPAAVSAENPAEWLPSDDEEEGDFEKESAVVSKSRTTGQEVSVAGKRAGKRQFVEKKGIVDVLCAHLMALSKLTFLRRSVHSADLLEAFMRFLTHKRTDVQRAALHCMYAYKTKALDQYRDMLFSLMEDSNFKTRLTSISVDLDTGSLKPQHRQHVLPVLTRILYGRMRTSTGAGAASRDNSAARRRLVAGFLAGCQPTEITDFIHLCLDFLTNVSADATDSSLVQLVRAVSSDCDQKRAVPLRRLQSGVLLLSAVFYRLGRLLLPSIPALLRLLLTAAAQVAALINSCPPVAVHHGRTLKKIKNMLMKSVTEMFERFLEHEWSADQLNAVFETCVWPYLSTFSQDYSTASSPAGLLKLLLTWANHERYAVLLLKQNEDGLSAMTVLMQLLNTSSCQPAVSAAILRAVDKLLIHKPPVDDDLAPLKATNMPEITYDDDDAVSAGSAVVVQHVGAILQHLRGRVQRPGGASRLSVVEMAVLSRVCGLQEAAAREHALPLASLILPVLSASRPPPEQRQKQLLHVLRQLLRVADQPDKLLKPLSALFSALPSAECHRMVVSCLQSVAARQPQHEQLCSMVVDLNAVSSGSLHQPDYDTRLVAFGRVNEMMRLAERVDDVLLRLVVHNCFWSIEHEDDMAIRDSAVFTLQQVAQLLGRLYRQPPAAGVLSNCLLACVRVRLRARDDRLRHDAVAVLQSAVLHCGPHDPRLKQLAALSNTVDQEQDFYRNIVHIQLHRRTRALKRLLEGLSDGSLEIRAEVVTNYLLPLANAYLFNDKYSKQTGLVDTAVQLMGVSASRMSWHQYHLFMRHYLRILPSCAMPRHAVKLLVAILDNFPFQLPEDTCHQLLDTVVPGPELSELPAAGGDVSDSVLELPESDSATAAAAVDTISCRDDRQAALIVSTLVGVTVPGLLAAMSRAVTGEHVHALAAGSSTAEDTDQQRAARLPLALAVVKLLHKLPTQAARFHLSGVLARVCELLQSRVPSVRTATLDTLVSCVKQLGVGSLSTALEELRAALTRGYQLHVLLHSAAALLRAVSSGQLVQHGQLDVCVSEVLKLCHMELFEMKSEDRENQQCEMKVDEARSVKSYHMLLVLSRHVGEQAMFDVVRHLTQWTGLCRSSRFSSRLAECLRQTCIGLTENEQLPPTALLVLCHGLLSQRISFSKPPHLDGGVIAASPAAVATRRPADQMLVPPAPGRSGAPAKVNSSVNEHLLVEFGLSLLAAVLRKDRVSADNAEHTAMLDPLLPLLANCLQHTDVKLVTSCLRCWLLLVRYKLRSLPDHVCTLRDNLFIILHKYAVPGLTAGINFDMVTAAFKVVTSLVRDETSLTLTEQQLRVLLTYSEQDLAETSRPGERHSLSVLRAVLQRKLTAPELHAIMAQVCRVAVCSVSCDVRGQCRALLMRYLLDYPLTGAALDKHVTFILQQLSYSTESGRLAALDITADVCKQFPQKSLEGQCAVMFLYLAARLVNDVSTECRQRVSEVVTILLQRVSTDKLSQLTDMIVLWLQDQSATKKLQQRSMSALLVGCVTSDSGVAGRLSQLHRDCIFIALCQLVSHDQNDYYDSPPASATPVQQQGSDDSDSGAKDSAVGLLDTPEHQADLLLFQLLKALQKLLTRFPQLLAVGGKHDALVNAMWGDVQQCLLHRHVWVRLAAGQLVEQLLSQLEPSTMSAQLVAEGGEGLPQYVCHSPTRFLRSLTLDLCVQLSSQPLSEQLANQCVTNLVWVGKVLIAAGLLDSPAAAVGDHMVAPPTAGDCVVASPTTAGVSLRWLVRRLRREVNAEVCQRTAATGAVTSRRSAVFRWLAAVSQLLAAEQLLQLLPQLLPPMMRELQDPSSDLQLRTLATEVTDVMRCSVGVEAFSAAAAAVQRHLQRRKTERRVQRAAQLLTNPAKSAQMKIQHQLKKKESSKRKMMLHKKGVFKRRKV